MERHRKRVMDARAIDKALARMAHQIIERNEDLHGLALVGILSGGVPLAARIGERIRAAEGVRPQLGSLDITLYRDDWSRLSYSPIVRPTEMPFSVDDMTVVLVDDVIFTGRTARAALDALLDLGRPRKVELAVLVDRGLRELPIQPNYTGLVLPTDPQEHVNVYLKESDDRDEVVVETAVS